MTIFLLILGLVLFIGLVVAHEFGHFIMARRGGVEVEEFGVGFPPRAKVLTKKNGTEYTLNWLPLGGFVKLKGEHDSDTKPGTYGAASLGTKVKIMLAGVVVNAVIAVVLLTFLALVGLPTLITKDNLGESQFTVASDQRTVRNEVLLQTIESQSPADKAGLRQLDRIIRIEPIQGGTPRAITSISDMQAATKALAGTTVRVTYERSDVTAQTNVVLRSEAEVVSSRSSSQPKGYIGVSLATYEVNRYTWSAPVVAIGLAGQMTKLTLEGLGSALQGLGGTIAGLVTGNDEARSTAQKQATEQVSGPLGIFFVLKSGAAQGVVMVLFIVAIISLTLAIMNVLPIPALDGGRLFVTLLYRVLRRPLTQRAEEIIHGTGFAVLMILIILITIVDTGRFF